MDVYGNAAAFESSLIETLRYYNINARFVTEETLQPTDMTKNFAERLRESAVNNMTQVLQPDPIKAQLVMPVDDAITFSSLTTAELNGFVKNFNDLLQQNIIRGGVQPSKS